MAFAGVAQLFTRFAGVVYVAHNLVAPRKTSTFFGPNSIAADAVAVAVYIIKLSVLRNGVCARQKHIRGNTSRYSFGALFRAFSRLFCPKIHSPRSALNPSRRSHPASRRRRRSHRPAAAAFCDFYGVRTRGRIIRLHVVFLQCVHHTPYAQLCGAFAVHGILCVHGVLTSRRVSCPFMPNRRRFLK